MEEKRRQGGDELETRRLLGSWWALSLGLCLLLAAAGARAEVEEISIARRELVAGGKSFGLAGAYELLEGRVRYALDPAAPGNRGIVDLDLAPRDADGKVRFAGDVVILKPVDFRRGNGGVLVEIPNRGGKAAISYFNRGARRSPRPLAAEELGDGFLQRRGFTVVWVGWQWDVPVNPDLLRLDPVFAEAPDGPLRGLVRADQVFDRDSPVLPLAHRDHRPYEVAGPSDPRNTLTVREMRLGQRRVIPRERWRFGRLDASGQLVEDRSSIVLEGGFEKGKIYEAVYVAERPAVVGLGLAAVRDLVSHLKHSRESPVPASRALALGISQTGRFLRHFLYQGFNRDLAGRRVLDGALIQTAGGGRGSFNHRLAQPSRDAHPFSAFFYPTDLFPFSAQTQRDPVSGREEGLLRAYEGAPELLPKVFFTNTGYEYWGRAAALIHTDVSGTQDLPPPQAVRIYHLAGAQHFVDRFPPAPRGTRYAANPLNIFWGLRALLARLDEWVAEGTEPPPSRIPLLSAGTLVPPDKLAFPSLPGVTVPTRAHEAYRVDYGPRFWTQGVVDLEPPRVGAAFPSRVPQVDADGNEISGVRFPELEVPLATYTPWNWRVEEIGAAGELADFRGSFLPLARTAAEREAAGDPRPSVEERYGSREAYLGRYTEAALRRVAEGFLLAEDLPELVEYAGELWQLVAGPETASPASTAKE